MPANTYTGVVRRRTSSRRVRYGDRAARCCITAGGLATIVAVALVCGFLFWVVLPLLLGAGVGADTLVTQPGPHRRLVHQSIDPFQQVVWQLGDDGHVRLIALASGQLVQELTAFDAATVPGPPAIGDDRIDFGTGSGQVGSCRVVVDTTLVAANALPPDLQALAPGQGAISGPAWFARTTEGARRFALQVVPEPPLDLGQRAVVLVDVAPGSSGETLAALTVDRRLHLRTVSRRVDQITDEVHVQSSGSSLALADLGVAELPDRLLLGGAGDNVYLLWNDGRLVRVDSRDVEAPKLAETTNLLPEADARVTACRFLVGRNTLLVGDSRGRVRTFFRTKPAPARGADGSQLDAVRAFQGPACPVVDLAASTRSRLFLAGFADGSLRLWHATSAREIGAVAVPAAERLAGVAIAPKEDGLLAATGRALHCFALARGHPEVTFAALLRPVWYEGYERPAHVWQSTSGTDDFEPKLGLWPLVFGTLKATLYCLLFGVPLALLAALYTSEFLHPRQRARVKPLVELMASLPSVVLGFLAALVFAPLVQNGLAAILATFATVPFLWLLGAQVVRALPSRLRVACERRRLLLVAATLPLGLLLGVVAGRTAEAVLFDGDLQAWLSARDRDAGAPGSAFGGWLVALLPVAALAASVGLGRTRWQLDRPYGGFLRVLLGTAGTIAAAAAFGALLTAAGLDLRGPMLGTYVQRNALVVGFVMGFAVIPIVYTIAEDALTAVPEHLRAASLGAGATPWQTGVRIVLPTALSGIFSAVMIGLGRAIGETMIVLMAAGNTPVLELNPFNGFRTLSANIATELQEAVVNSTHYRVLYLAALALFAATFVLNSLAEIVRQRFRRRAWQL